MGKFVKPKTYLIGYSSINIDGLRGYLNDTGNEDFFESLLKAREAGLSDGEIMASFYAKLCYASLSLGKNSNLSRIRDIPDNLVACMAAGHGSVFGHASINFVTTDCSRVLTHELVRNHIGTEYSQQSGRYTRLDSINLVHDKILEGCEGVVSEAVRAAEDAVYIIECRKGLREPPSKDPLYYGVDPARGEFFFTPEQTLDFRNNGRGEEAEKYKWVPAKGGDFAHKKKLTSAIRRIAPNGQANEIGWSINLRALRHVIQVRTSRHAEWEIRLVMDQAYHLVKEKFPMIFHDAKEAYVDGLVEVSGMKTQPYTRYDREVIDSLPTDELRRILALREQSGE